MPSFEYSLLQSSWPLSNKSVYLQIKQTVTLVRNWKLRIPPPNPFPRNRNKQALVVLFIYFCPVRPRTWCILRGILSNYFFQPYAAINKKVNGLVWLSNTKKTSEEESGREPRNGRNKRGICMNRWTVLNERRITEQK